jgi:hypothetical protein
LLIFSTVITKECIMYIKIKLTTYAHIFVYFATIFNR